MTIVADHGEWRVRHLPGADFRLKPYTLDRLVHGKWELSVGFYSNFCDALNAADPPRPPLRTTEDMPDGATGDLAR